LNLDYKFIAEKVILFYQISPKQRNNYIGGMNFSLPWPVPLNALYSPTKTGRVYMAHAGKQYKQDAAWIAKSQIKKPLDGPLSLVISAYPGTVKLT
jgi:hypothetical protein